MGDDLNSIEEQFDVYDEMMSDYFDEMASSIFGPHWWAKPGRNLYMDLTTIQQVKFSRLVTLIKKKNYLSKSSALWQFTDIVCNEPHMRFVGKLCVILKTSPRLLLMIGFAGLILFGLSLILLLVF